MRASEGGARPGPPTKGRGDEHKMGQHVCVLCPALGVERKQNQLDILCRTSAWEWIARRRVPGWRKNEVMNKTFGKRQKLSQKVTQPSLNLPPQARRPMSSPPKCPSGLLVPRIAIQSVWT